MSRKISNVLNPETTNFDYSSHKFYYKHRLDDALKYKDNPEQFKGISGEFQKMIDGMEIWDFGGSCGIDYFLHRPNNCTWVVWEQKETVDFCNIYLKDYPNLIFRETKNKLNRVTDKDIAIFTRSVLSYLPSPLTWLTENIKKVNIVMIKELCVGKETYLTTQEGVGPFWVFGLEELKEIFKEDFDIKIEMEENSFWEIDETGKENYNPIKLLAIRK